jgi:hypothetical protein
VPTATKQLDEQLRSWVDRTPAVQALKPGAKPSGDAPAAKGEDGKGKGKKAKEAK